MRFKVFSVAMLISGLLFLLIGFALFYFALQSYASVDDGLGIIGGADVPTYQFMLIQSIKGWPLCLILFGTAFLITGLFCLIFKKTVTQSCSIPTSVIAAVLSMVVGLGLTCVSFWFVVLAFLEFPHFPLSFLSSILLSLVCLLAFIDLIILYVHLRKAHWSIKGLLIDLFTAVLYLPPCFFFFFFLFDCLSKQG